MSSYNIASNGYYTVAMSGSWPMEEYLITPTYFNSKVAGLSSMKYLNLFRFVDNPINDINNVTDVYNQIDFNFGNANSYVDPESDTYQITSKTSNNTFTWKPSTLRTYNIGDIFNNFILSISSFDNNSSQNPVLSSINQTNTANNLFDAAYLLYPQRLFLKPISLSANNNGTFNLQTSTVLLSTNVLFVGSNVVDHDSYVKHTNYKFNQPYFNPIRGNSIPVNLVYSLSASKNVINNVLTYTPNFNPFSFNVQLEDNNIYIVPNSINIKYNITTYNYLWNQMIPLGQFFPEEVPTLWYDFRSSFINNFNLNSINYQTLQLTQSSINPSAPLQDFSNCILSISLSCNSPTSFRYNNATYKDNFGNRYPYCKPDFNAASQSLKLKYIAESPYYFNSLSNTLSSVGSTTFVTSNSGLIPLNVPISDGSTPFDTMVWTIPYSPHYYSFKTSFTNNAFPNPSDTYSLRFNLSSGVTKQYTASGATQYGQTEFVYLSSCLASDFGILNVDLPTYAPNDFISLNVIDFPKNTPYVLDEIFCYYGSNLDQVYDIINSPFVPTSEGSQFLLVYPLSSYGPFNITLRTRLSSSIFNYISESNNATFIHFASGQNNVYKAALGYPISLKVINEEADNITVDSSFLTSYPDFPSKNLLTLSDTNSSLQGNSLISWNFNSNNVNPNCNITLQSVNPDGTFLSAIPINQPIPFNSNSWTVSVSGYGPNTVNVTLSSQKYNQTATLSSNPNLFNILSHNKFNVGVANTQILGKTVSYTVTATVPYNQNSYQIPTGIPMYWVWSYDNKTTNLPITAFYNNTPFIGNTYSNGSTNFSDYLSSIVLNVQLSSSLNSFNIHNLSVSAISHYNNPYTIGNSNISVLDYPSDNIFNTYFRTAYNFTGEVVNIYFQSQPIIQLYPWLGPRPVLVPVQITVTNGVVTNVVNQEISWYDINQFYQLEYIIYSPQNSPFIANTSANNVLSRPNTDFNSFKFSTGEIVSNLVAPVIQWVITDNTGHYYSLSSTSANLSSISTFNYVISSPSVTSTNVSLCALSATIAGWTIPHNLVSTQTIYTLPTAQFFAPTNFLIYPPYTWHQGNSGYLTIVNNNNFTVSQAPTAYAHNNTNSQNFYVSANKGGLYQYGYANLNDPSVSLFSTFNTNNHLINLPYVNDLSSNRGLTVYLTAFNNFFPRRSVNSLNYIGLTSNNSTSGLYLGNYSIASNTNSFNNLTYSKNGLSAFNQSPKLVGYDTLQLQFSTVDTAVVFDYNTVTQLGLQFTPVTSIDLDNNIFVGVLQTLTVPNTANTPVRALQNPNSYVTYSLSSLSGGWVSQINVPMVNGLYDLFILNIGDGSQPLTVDNYVQNHLLLNASATLSAYIPSTTYNLATSYTGSYDSWNVIEQKLTTATESFVVYATAVKPEIYISSYYATTGDNIFIQFKTPYLQNTPEANVAITSYNIYFGDGLSAYHLVNDITQHSYQSEGTYTLSYQVNYNNGSSLSFQLPNTHAITVYNTWPTYDQSKIRLLTEEYLTLPWTVDQVDIQPNEYADADIFNTAMSRLYDNLEYLIYNTQTINTDSPTLFYGWLGTSQNNVGRGIQWHTQDFLSGDYVHPNYATVSSAQNAVSPSFSNIKDLVQTDYYTFVLDGLSARAFTTGANPTEIFFDNINEVYQLLVNPVSIDYDEPSQNLYVLDQYYNKIYKLNLSFDYINEINIQLVVGNYGGRQDPNKFNSPTELIYLNDNVYVLDYQNHCLKHYTEDLNWIYTYYNEEFDINVGTSIKPIYTNNPECFAVHPTTEFPYILTISNKIYVFDTMGDLITSFQLTDQNGINLKAKPIKIIFDKNGNFMYVLYSNEIIKFTLTGTFISYVDKIPSVEFLNFTSAKYSNSESLVFSTSNSIIKCQDIVTLFKVGEGLPYQYWTKDQILISRDEFTMDNVYNRAFTRLIQNIKTFRNTMNSKFVIVTESTPYGQIQYFSKTPILVSSRPVFADDIENENVQVGVNEFNIPQVLNRELGKIYNALNYLAGYLTVTDNRNLSGINTGCSNPFCWSWKGMSCYNLTLPVIRICNINPITYAELQSNFPSSYSFSSSQQLTKTWGEASSDCCNDTFYPNASS
jgi:hypothetical protein